MNILYCGDAHIADGLMISILSLLRCVPEPLRIYVLTMSCQLGERSWQPLPQEFTDCLDARVRLEKPGSFVRRFDLTDAFSREMPMANMDTRFTPCCMLRLFADQIPELPGRVLYLDNDVVCRQDPSAFYHQELQDYELAGVLDYYGRWFFRRKLFRLDYLNSGVLLLNLDRIRQTGLFAACRKRCQEKEMFMPDQSAINKLSNARKTCPRRYNEQRKLHRNTVFQHFTTSFRFLPWFRIVSVKPWHTEKMHTELKLTEYDDLLAEYAAWKGEYASCHTPEVSTR